MGAGELPMQFLRSRALTSRRRCKTISLYFLDGKVGDMGLADVDSQGAEMSDITSACPPKDVFCCWPTGLC